MCKHLQALHVVQLAVAAEAVITHYYMLYSNLNTDNDYKTYTVLGITLFNVRTLLTIVLRTISRTYTRCT